MEIIRLPTGETAPLEADCISVDSQEDGTFLLSGTALSPSGDADPAESIAMVGSRPYPSYEEAEAAGLEWASTQGVQQVYVSRDATLPF